MKTSIFIPQRINVGFQERSDTYTKKLAYVIYYDHKGVLRKEASWNSWRDGDIEPKEFKNEPMSGFVLNKKAGDYSDGWNHRQAYCRVYDPRDFEFEITIENLLYILENTSSIKGKGLEGEFVYGWDGKDLVLMPTSSPDYKEISEFNEIIHNNKCIKAKDLKLGAIYKTKNNEEWIYMGRFDYWDYGTNKGKYHFFVREYKYEWSNSICFGTLQLKSLGEKFIGVVNEECAENYADLFDKLESDTSYSPYDSTKDKYIPYEFEEFQQFLIEDRYWCRKYYRVDQSKVTIRKDSQSNKYYIENNDNYNYWNRTRDLFTAEELFNKIQPMWKKKYLANGKFYREDK